MSKIQEALRKFQKGPMSGDKPDTRPGRRTKLPESVVPIARSKVVPAGVERYHLNEKNLIRGGLLAPLDHAIPVSDEFRRIKRPLLENVTKHRDVIKDHMNTIMVASSTPMLPSRTSAGLLVSKIAEV
jgi:hypothetical protein